MTQNKHIPRLAKEIISLLSNTKSASLATFSSDDKGELFPFISFIPFAVNSDKQCIVFCISQLAQHYFNIVSNSKVSILINQSDVIPVHKTPRITFLGNAFIVNRDSLDYEVCRRVYLDKFPDARYITELPDFDYFTFTPQSARQIAGFGTARSIEADELGMIFKNVVGNLY